MTLNSVTLTGKLPGAGRGATATFVPSGWETDGTDNQIFAPIPVTVTLAGDGTFTVLLLATDNPAPQPAGWTWQVTIAGIAGVAAYSFSFLLPFSGGSTQDLSDLVPVAPPVVLASKLTVGPSPPPSPAAGDIWVEVF